jgi:hypothetical protein
LCNGTSAQKILSQVESTFFAMSTAILLVAVRVRSLILHATQNISEALLPMVKSFISVCCLVFVKIFETTQILCVHPVFFRHLWQHLHTAGILNTYPYRICPELDM